VANIVSSCVWTVWAIGLGAVPGAMIEPNSNWLLISFVLVLVLTVGLSAVIMFRPSGRRHK